MDSVEKLKPNTGKPMDQLEYSRAIGYLIYHSVLEAYSDARWINHVEDSSSTSGWVFLLGGCAISWASMKQTCITGSTIESKFVGLVAAGKEAERIRNLIHEISIWPKPIAPISIRYDSAATLAKAYSEIYNGMSRHLGVRHSMIRELIRNGVISIEFVRSQHNLADQLIKGIARDLVINKSRITLKWEEGFVGDFSVIDDHLGVDHQSDGFNFALPEEYVEGYHHGVIYQRKYSQRVNSSVAYFSLMHQRVCSLAG
nr:zinc finger, CCHC-type [Tanacetum cinerariifolium]